MSNPKCAACGHLNRVGAEICEMCDTRFEAAGASSDEPRDAAGGRPFYAHANEPRAGALPTDIPLPRFVGAGDVISPTLDVYKSHFLLIGLLVLATTLPLVMLQYGVYFISLFGSSREIEIAPESGLDIWLYAFTGGATLLSALVAMLGNALLSGALAYGVIEVQRTGEAKAIDCLRWGLRKLLAVFLVSLGYNIMTVGGYLLLIVPGVILSLMFALAMPIAAIEGRGIVESFTRSAALTKGYRGQIFLTFFLWGLLIFIVSMIVGGSFAVSGTDLSVPALFFQTLINQMLQSSTIVLTIYIFFGILNEERHGFETRVFTRDAPADDEEGYLKR